MPKVTSACATTGRAAIGVDGRSSWLQQRSMATTYRNQVNSREIQTASRVMMRFDQFAEWGSDVVMLPPKPP
jgi:hypothetical protein